MIGFSDDEALAAEYVLGTLDLSERAAAEERRRIDAVFEGLVQQWEERMAPLVSAVPEVAPPSELLPHIMSRISPVPPAAANDNVIAMRRQLRVWRGLTAFATALAALLAIWIVQRAGLPSSGGNQTYVAVLQQGADTPSFVVSLDLTTRRMTVLPIGTSVPSDKSYEVWMIGTNNAAPRSMGIINSEAALRPLLPDLDRNEISAATYAVTLEPRGGSPTGQPTSAPVFVGKLKNAAL